jgi:hypothetical protein
MLTPPGRNALRPYEARGKGLRVCYSAVPGWKYWMR